MFYYIHIQRCKKKIKNKKQAIFVFCHQDIFEPIDKKQAKRSIMITKNLVSKSLVITHQTDPATRISRLLPTADNAALLTFANAINSLQREAAHSMFVEERSTLVDA